MPSRSPITPPKRVEAEVFHRRMRAGRNRAVLLGARGDDNEPVDCVVKLPALTENPTLHPLPSLLEWVASCLASDLGVSTPEPYELNVAQDFAESILDGEIRAGACNSLGSVFASSFVTGTSMVAGDLVDPSVRPAAAILMAFDVFIHNVDRRATNSNLFLGCKEPVAFDHGDAFAFVWPILGAPDPVDDPLLSLLDKHALAACVRGRAAPDLSDFRTRLLALDNSRLAELEAAAPSTWQTGVATEKLRQILDILRQRRDAVEKWLPQVEAWMQG